MSDPTSPYARPPDDRQEPSEHPDPEPRNDRSVSEPPPADTSRYARPSSGEADEPTRVWTAPSGVAQPPPPAPAQPPPPAQQTQLGDSTWSASSGMPTAPVERRRGSRVRWAIALGATALVVLIAVGALLFFSQRSAAPGGATSYLPATTAMYGEMRLDLPGDQRPKVAEFLSHFPGLADKAALESKVDQRLDQLLREATQQRYSYTGDLKPWFNGQVSAAVLEFPRMDRNGEAEAAPAALITLGVTDQAKAQATLDKIRSDAQAAGTQFTEQSYAGTKIWTASSSGPTPGAYAVTPDVVLVAGRTDDIKKALDTRNRTQGAPESLASSADFSKTLAAMKGDRLATIVMNVGQLRDVLLAGSQNADPISACLSRSSAAAVTGQFVVAFRAENDRAVMESRMAPAPAGQQLPSRESALAGRVAANTVVFFETRDAGKAISTFLTQVKSCLPEDEQVDRQLRQVEGVLGTELESFFDWVGDVAVAASVEGDIPQGGIVATVLDESKARERVSRLQGLLSLALASGNVEGVEESEEDYKGARITHVDIDLEAVAPEGSTPPGLERLRISHAVHDGVFVFGIGDTFVKGVLDKQGGNSLGAQQRFQDALKSVGGPQTGGLAWVDLSAIRGRIETAVPEQMRGLYEREYKPYVTPLDQFVAVSMQDGQDLVSRAALIVK